MLALDQKSHIREYARTRSIRVNNYTSPKYQKSVNWAVNFSLYSLIKGVHKPLKSDLKQRDYKDNAY